MAAPMAHRAVIPDECDAMAGVNGAGTEPALLQSHGSTAALAAKLFLLVSQSTVPRCLLTIQQRFLSYNASAFELSLWRMLRKRFTGRCAATYLKVAQGTKLVFLLGKLDQVCHTIVVYVLRIQGRVDRKAISLASERRQQPGGPSCPDLNGRSDMFL